MRRVLVITIASLLLCGTLLAQVAAKPAEPASSTSMSSESNPAVSDQLKKIEDDWARATMNKDRAALDRIEADNYVFVMPDGNVRNKTQDLDSLAKSNYTAFSNRDLQVRTFGNTAEVLGVAHLAGTENGQDITGDYRFTDVFVNNNGQWQAVSTQATKLQPASSQSSSPNQH